MANDTDDSSKTPMTTADPQYAQRLANLQLPKWKLLLDVQAPYRWCMDKLNHGFTLDIGCGIGRSLSNLRGNGVGVDHNSDAVAICRSRGFTAYTLDDFFKSEFNIANKFDSLLLAHVLEHLTLEESVSLLQTHYIHLLKPGGQLIVITPQERGYRSDPTHVTFMDFTGLSQVNTRLGLTTTKQFSYPFPRSIGKLFIYNEFISVGKKP